MNGLNRAHSLAELQELLGDLGGPADGSDQPFDHVCLPEKAAYGTISWIRGRRRMGGGVYLVDDRSEPISEPRGDRIVVRCQDAKAAMARVLAEWCLGDLCLDVSPRASVHASAVVGAEGQGYDWDGKRWLRFPQVGGVIIEADAEVGPCSTVMRAAIGHTVIREGAKIGNGVNIGHGAYIGAHALLSAHVTVGGSSRIGDRAVLWQNVCVKQGVEIGEGAVVGMGSVVICNVPPRTTWVGNPAHMIRPEYNI